MGNIMTNSITKFKVQAGSNLWKGLSRQEHKFHIPLGELIDNSLSARIKKNIGSRKESIFIEINIEEKNDGTISIIIADNGTGITYEQIIDENNSIFNLGHTNVDKGSMNEHGFGLKNAIAMLTSGATENFSLLTKYDDKLYCVDGPLGPEMGIKEALNNDWEEGLNDLKNSKSGVKIHLTVQDDYFKTVNTLGGLYSFDTCVRRLGEHLGIIYNTYLKENDIEFHYKSKNQTEFTSQKINPIPTPFSKSTSNKKDIYNLQVEVDGQIYRAEYTMGVLDQSIKHPEAENELGWPYPLKQYHQGSNARCGVTIISRDKVLKTAVFSEIWSNLAGNVSYNNFLAELKFDENFPTVNQKNNIDPTTPQYQRIIQKLVDEEEYQPKSSTQKNNESTLQKKIIKNIKSSITDDITTPGRKVVWDGGAEIDIYYKNNDTNKVVMYELKIDKAIVKDVYQLEMYWDALVEEGFEIDTAILVADSFSANVDKVINNTNSKVDIKHNKYKITKKLVSDF